MPLTGPPYMGDDEIERIVRWIDAGAQPAPGEPPEAVGTARSEQEPAAPGDDASPEEPAAADDEADDPARVTPEETVTFADIEPILLQRCVSCHSDGGMMGRPPEGLRLGSYEEVVHGSDRVVLVPGSPGASELMRRIVGRSLPRMPFDGPPYLNDDQERLIRTWIEQGAADAEGRSAPTPAGVEVRLHGILTGRWLLDGLPLQVVAGTRMEDGIAPGDYVQVRGVVEADGSIRVERIRAR